MTADVESVRRRHAAWFDHAAEQVTTTNDETRIVTCPYNGEQVGTVPSCSATDVETAVASASAAADEWADRTVEERAAVVDRFGELVLEEREALLDVLQLETGKARIDAVEEVVDVVANARYAATEGPTTLTADRRRGVLPGLVRPRIHHDPVGVVGVISPWNYPLTLSLSDALAALVAGNAVVVKPDENAPFSALTLVDLLHRAGIPTDLVQVVTGRGETLGPSLVEGVDHVCFTGSTAVGRTVAEQAGRELVSTSLELGGNNPLVVLDDADLDTAVTGAVRACFANAGQLCIATQRVYVEEPLFDRFRERFVRAVENLTLGATFDLAPDVGVLFDEDHVDSVEAVVDDADERGATVLTGGERRPDVGPTAYAPTVLTGVRDGMQALDDEVFGPVTSLVPVEHAHAAVERANDTAYGLHASVWSADTDRARAVARRIETGSVAVNDAYVTTWGSADAPIGGVDASGYGRRHGPEGVRRFTRTQSVVANHGPPVVPPQGPGVLRRGYVKGLFALQRLYGALPISGR